jgi:hypothetical protein
MRERSSSYVPHNVLDQSNECINSLKVLSVMSVLVVLIFEKITL